MKKKLLLPLLVFALSSWLHAEKEIFKDDIVTAAERMPFLFPILNVHGDTVISLNVFGKKYDRVRGAKPFYLKIEAIGAILFAVDDGPGRLRIVVANLKTKSFLEIIGKSLDFGNHIGGDRKREDKVVDYVEHADEHSLTLVAKRDGWRDVIAVDLDAKRILRADEYVYGEGGRIIHRYRIGDGEWEK